MYTRFTGKIQLIVIQLIIYTLFYVHSTFIRHTSEVKHLDFRFTLTILFVRYFYGVRYRHPSINRGIDDIQ